MGSGDPPAWLFDPQTSGGLLAGVNPAVAGDVVRALQDRGYEQARIIGEVIAVSAREPPAIHIHGRA
jgi:selenide,water dikinase